MVIFLPFLVLYAAWLGLVTAIRLIVTVRHKKVSLKFPTDYRLGNPENPALILWVLGDSHLTGYGVERREESLSHQIGLEIANCGRYVSIQLLAKSGSYIENVLLEQVPLVKPGPEDIVCLFIGGMDVTHLKSLKKYGKLFNQVLDELESLGAGHVIVASCPSQSRCPSVPAPLKPIYMIRCWKENRLVKQSIKGRSVRYVNIFKEGKLRFYHYCSDGSHPNAKGIAVWARCFRKVIRETLH